MALITCKECNKEISSQAHACPHCGHPMATGAQTANSVTCPKCNAALIAITKPVSTSLGGILGIIGVLIGMLMLLVNYVIALLIIIVSIIIGNVGRPKQTVMTCPNCGHKGNIL